MLLEFTIRHPQIKSLRKGYRAVGMETDLEFVEWLLKKSGLGIDVGCIEAIKIRDYKQVRDRLEKPDLWVAT